MTFRTPAGTALLAAMALILGALAFLPANASAGSANVSSVTDSGLDEDGDGSFEFLSLELSLKVSQAGDYFVTGTMSPSGLEETASVQDRFGAGTHTVELLFDGEAIASSGIDGPYVIEITLFFDGERQGPLTHVTSDYDSKDFGAPPEGGGAEAFEYDGRIVQVEYEVLKVDIDVTSPSLTFYYAIDGGENARFSVEYTELVAFDDTDMDGTLGGADEVLASADLSRVEWTHDLHFKSYAGGDAVLKAVELSALVPLDLGGDSPDPVSITFYYPTHNDESNTGAQRKFDITLAYPGPLDADALALKHVARDLGGDHRFVQVGPDGAFDRLEFVSDSGDEMHGFYEWTPDIELTSASGTTSAAMVATASQGADRDSVELTFNYPARGLSGVYHDPVVGVNPDVDFEKLGQEVQEILHNPAVYLAAALLAAVVAFVPVWRSSRKSL